MSFFFTPVAECEKSSPTSYFWYRNALDITDSIDETGSFNTYIVCCLLAAWTIVCLGMFKGIKSSVKVTVCSVVTFEMFNCCQKCISCHKFE